MMLMTDDGDDENDDDAVAKLSRIQPYPRSATWIMRSAN